MTTYSGPSVSNLYDNVVSEIAKGSVSSSLVGSPVTILDITGSSGLLTNFSVAETTTSECYIRITVDGTQITDTGSTSWHKSTSAAYNCAYFQIGAYSFVNPKLDSGLEAPRPTCAPIAFNSSLKVEVILKADGNLRASAIARLFA